MSTDDGEPCPPPTGDTPARKASLRSLGEILARSALKKLQERRDLEAATKEPKKTE